MGKKTKHFNVEKGFLSKLVETKDFKILKDQQIKLSFFTGENKNIFLFIQKNYKENGEVPTARAVNRKFPNYEFETYNNNGTDTVGTEETLMYWCSELRTKSLHNNLAESVETIAEKLEENEAEEAYAIMKKSVWTIEEEVVLSTSVDITQNTEDRITAYKERKKHKGMMGIPTGIPLLDYVLKGLINGTLTTIIATSGVGKTWFLILLACYAQINNYKVCFFITEMSTELMQDRFDAMLFGMLHGDFNYEQFKAGALPIAVEKEYYEFLEETLPNLEPLILENATGISSVVSVMERENPDIVFIDGAYLMEDEQGAKDDWLRVTHITRDLKKTAKNRNKPIVINTQADKNTSKRTGPELESIMYSQAIGQDSDVILSLYRDELMKNDEEMGIKVLKQREGVLATIIISWCFKKMKFKSIYSDDGKEVIIDGEYTEVDDEETNENVLGLED